MVMQVGSADLFSQAVQHVQGLFPLTMIPLALAGNTVTFIIVEPDRNSVVIVTISRVMWGGTSKL